MASSKNTPQESSSLAKICKEINEYNQKHKTFITYGQYVAMREGKTIPQHLRHK